MLANTDLYWTRPPPHDSYVSTRAAIAYLPTYINPYPLADQPRPPKPNGPSGSFTLKNPLNKRMVQPITDGNGATGMSGGYGAVPSSVVLV